MRILKKYNIEDFIFLDIETVPVEQDISNNLDLFDAWEYYCIKNGIENVQEEYWERAALFGEFGKIVALTVGIVRGGKIHLKTFHGEERQLLLDFNDMLEKFPVNNKTWLCGHHIIGFDCPFIMKRCLINRVPLHPIIDMAHEKPWTVPYFDTAQLWKGTGFKMSSLISIVTSLGLPSPKDDISGSQVKELYYNGEIDRILRYCEKDVIAVINIVRVLRGEDPLEVASVPKEKEKVSILQYLFQGGKYTDEVKTALKEAYNSLSEDEKPLAMEILNAIPSRAKGKVTDLTKKDIKELCE